MLTVGNREIKRAQREMVDDNANRNFNGISLRADLQIYVSWVLCIPFYRQQFQNEEFWGTKFWLLQIICSSALVFSLTIV